MCDRGPGLRVGGRSGWISKWTGRTEFQKHGAPATVDAGVLVDSRSLLQGRCKAIMVSTDESRTHAIELVVSKGLVRYRLD